MRILVAPNAFKGSYSPSEVARALSDGIAEFSRTAQKDITVDEMPLADGGDCTIEAVAASFGRKPQTLEVSGSLGEPRQALWLELDSCAVVELASACGIAGLAKDQLRPLSANSLGLGTVLKHVIENTNIPEIVVAVGGSASTDGGSGAIYELGAKFFDSQERQFVPAGGGSLLALSRCDLSAARLRLRGKKLMVATDVFNPLLGPEGAAQIFAPQKGASKDDVVLLDQALSHYADLVEADINTRLRYSKGSGAAGGTAFGLAAVGATIISGFEWLSRMLGLPERISRCDLVITGEGRTDLSSFQGKVVGSLNDLCLLHNKPLWIFSGSVSEDVRSKTPDGLAYSLSSEDQIADALKIKQAVFDALVEHYNKG